MSKPIYTNPENPGKSVLTVPVGSVKFFFRCALKTRTQKLNGSNLNGLKYLIWNSSTSKPIGSPDVATYLENLKNNPAKISKAEVDEKFWVETKEVPVIVGQKVGIYLNTEVDFKQNLLYEFEVKGNASVVILEGQDNLVPQHYTQITEERPDDKTQIIRGYLTAEAWFKITHRYTPDEARRLLDKTSYPEHIKAAIVTIYEGKTKAPIAKKGPGSRRHFLSIPYPQGGSFGLDDYEGGGNSNYTFFAEANMDVDSVEVITRTSPIAYAAVIHAAMKNNFREIKLNSLWRCMFGSVLHREGRAIDVGNIDGQPVYKDPAKYKPQQNEWKTYQTKKQEALNEYNRNGKVGEKPRDNPTVTEFGQIQALGTIRLKESKGLPLTEEEKANKDKWSQVEDKLLGFSGIRLLRVQLQADPNVTSLFDPWLMDKVVGDSNAGDSNQFTGDLQKNHHHHLHITVRKTL
jgi:hypothetical protein